MIQLGSRINTLPMAIPGRPSLPAIITTNMVYCVPTLLRALVKLN